MLRKKPIANRNISHLKQKSYWMIKLNLTFIFYWTRNNVQIIKKLKSTKCYKNQFCNNARKSNHFDSLKRVDDMTWKF